MQQHRFALHGDGTTRWSDRINQTDVPLPDRRRQVLALYLSGQPRMQIARNLGVSPHTIRNHIRIVYDDHGFTNRVQALRWALEQPVLAGEVLRNCDDSGEFPDAESVRQAATEPISVTNAIEEAIDYFRRRVIDSPMENI